MDLSDEELILKIASGDGASLELLYDRYAAAVMGLSLKILGDHPAAEDVVQETFWRVWRRAASYDSLRGSFIGWLFAIARNLCIDRLREGQPLPSTDTIDEVQPIADPRDPEEPVWLALKQAQVREAVLTLPQEQRTVIELAYFRGLTRQEIAASQGLPLGTVHSRARIALTKLREALKDSGYRD